MKIFSIISLIIGLVCAYVNINDPDPYLWIISYFLLVLLSLMHLFNRKKVWIDKIVVIIYAASLAFYIPDIFQWIKDGMPSVVGSMKAESIYIELVREGGGLLMSLILASVFFFNWSSDR